MAMGFIVCHMILDVLLMLETPKKARKQGIQHFQSLIQWMKKHPIKDVEQELYPWKLLQVSFIA